MVLFTVPSGHMSVKPRSPERLNGTVKAEAHMLTPSFLGGGATHHWHTHGSTGHQFQSAGPLRMHGKLEGRFRRVPEMIPSEIQDGSRGQFSPKGDNQLYGVRNRDREEYPYDRKRMKVHDNVHTVSSQSQLRSQLLYSQMQSQLLSPRGPAGPPGPALPRDSLLQGSNYGEVNDSGNGGMASMCSRPLKRPSPAATALDEPLPLGLTLRKTPSLLDLISFQLTKGGSSEEPSKEDVIEPEPAKNLPSKCLLPSVIAQDKLKASNFPASNLKVGTWERTSRYEGDLVGKCYYAKRKLVWEVLENGLKSKIEIQWSDISAMKASCPENLPGTLEIEVSRPPLFFREINPQPRKHTLWATATDFTGGQATICKRHSLQFPEGVLNRHYEKLVQCDPRLKALVEGALSMRPNPEFDQPSWMFHTKHQHLPAHQSMGRDHNNSLDGTHCDLPVIDLNHLLSLQSKAVSTHSGILSGPKADIGQMKMQPTDLSSPSSVMDPRGNDDSGTSDTEDLRLHDDLSDYDIDLTYPTPTSLGAHDVSDVKPSCNNLFLIGQNVMTPHKQRLDEISQGLLEVISGSNDINVMMNVSRLGYNGQSSAALAEESLRTFAVPLETTDASHLFPFSIPVKSEAGPEDQNWPGCSTQMSGRLFQREPSYSSLLSCLGSRHGSASDLLLTLPRVSSLPQLFDSPHQVPTFRYDPPSSRPSYLGGEKLR